MGNWGIGIMQDDVAIDTAINFKEALSEGLSVAAATDHLLQDPVYDLDGDDGPVTFLALAALQLWHGALQQDNRDKALGIIASGMGLWRWEDSVAEGRKDAAVRLAARTELLERFKAILERGACTREELLQIADTEPHGGPWSARSYL